MIRRSALSLAALTSVLAISPSLVGCSGAPEDASIESGEDSLTSLQLVVGGDPTRGLVGRGFNRRAPLSRLSFVSSLFSGSWTEVGATDRAQCVDFSSGVIAPTTTSMRTRASISILDTKEKLLAAASFDGAQTGDASVLLPLEGIPVNVGTTTNRTVSAETVTEIATDKVNVSLIASATLTDTLRGSGNATIRSAVINDINSMPAADRRSAFFAKCGDRYLDNVNLGGALAIDLSFTSQNSQVLGKLKARVNDSLSLGAGGASSSTSSTAPADAIGSLVSLFTNLGISTNTVVNAQTEVSIAEGKVTLTVNVRSLGPSIDLSNMTFQQLFDIAAALPSRVANRPAERAVLGAVLKSYSTATNVSQISASLPGEIDVSYPTTMAAVRANYLTHYAALNRFTELERHMVLAAPNQLSELWYDALPSLTTVQNGRRTALINAFANAQAMECLVKVVPGSATSAYNACLVQPVLGDTSATGVMGSKFRRTASGLPSFGSSTVNVITVGQGSYTAIPRRKLTFKIASTFAEFFRPMNAAGVTSPNTLREDRLADACNAVSVDGKLVFRSGPADDGDWLTGSRCDWSAFEGLETKKETGWSFAGKYAKHDVGANSVTPAGAYRTAPGNFSDSLGPISGRVAAEKWLATWSGVRLTEVVATGPLNVDPNNLSLVPGPMDVRLGLKK
jgi:hypothetical protein